jgi:hypothetical protein
VRSRFILVINTDLRRLFAFRAGRGQFNLRWVSDTLRAATARISIHTRQRRFLSRCRRYTFSPLLASKF